VPSGAVSGGRAWYALKIKPEPSIKKSFFTKLPIIIIVDYGYNNEF
jgi:hypothetical protein